eukprot:11227062-Lingulodinium_polyedra.AAC.1
MVLVVLRARCTAAVAVAAAWVFEVSRLNARNPAGGRGPATGGEERQPEGCGERAQRYGAYPGIA